MREFVTLPSIYSFNSKLATLLEFYTHSCDRAQKPNRRDSCSKADSAKGRGKKNLNCYECGGVGHLRNGYPLVRCKKLKCIGCKGRGHTKSECPNNLKKGKSLMCFSDTNSESESDKEEPLPNLTSFDVQNTLDDLQYSLGSDSEKKEKMCLLISSLNI